MMYSLNCTVSKTVTGLINSPTATWTIRGVAVANGNDITVSSTTDDMSTISTLTFDQLRTSHEGTYTCGGTLTSPALDTPLMPTVVENNNVQSKVMLMYLLQRSLTTLSLYICVKSWKLFICIN